MKKENIKIIIIGLMLIVMASCATTNASYVRTPPPRAKVVKIKSPKPYPNALWISGHWKWNARTSKYVWVEGYWIKAKPGKVWVAGRWEKRRHGWIWIEGHWKKK